MLWYGNRFRTRPQEGIIKEAHNPAPTTHRGSTKMDHDLKTHFWWVGIKRDITDFVAHSLTYQRV